jgi:hypothetical protein
MKQNKFQVQDALFIACFFSEAEHVLQSVRRLENENHELKKKEVLSLHNMVKGIKSLVNREI